MRRAAIRRDQTGEEWPSWRLCRWGNKLVVHITCPDGHDGALVAHSISSGGQVHPAICCPLARCDYYGAVRLEDWIGIAKPPWERFITEPWP